MKTLLISKSFTLLRKLALKTQIGNVAGKAPELILEPEEQEKLYGPFGENDNFFVWRLQNVICSGLYGGAIINKFNNLYLRFSDFPWGKELHPSLFLPYLGRKVKTLDKAIYLITPEAEGNYYHWVVDLMPRLLVLYNYKLSDLENRSIIIHGSIKPYEDDSLALLGVKKYKIVRLKSFETINVKDLIVADYQDLNIPFPLWKKQLLRKLNFNGATAAKKKIYLLRGKQAKRQLIGEERLISIMRELDFDIIDPQQLSFFEQINVFNQAEIVVSLHGAALTNMLFCKPKTLIIELRSTHLPPEFYSAIAETYDLSFDTICLPPSNVKKTGYEANKQSLILTEQGVNTLISKLLKYQVMP